MTDENEEKGNKKIRFLFVQSAFPRVCIATVQHFLQPLNFVVSSREQLTIERVQLYCQGKGSG